MPVERGRGSLPRWIREPAASDFAGPERLAFEASAGDGLACWGKPFSRFQYALDLFYGKDQWPSDLAKPPRWPGGWMPGRRYDPSAYGLAPDGPPEVLRTAVEEHQAEEDERMRQIVAQNSFPEHQAAMLVRIGVPSQPFGASEGG